jgi:hypothetical protein
MYSAPSALEVQIRWDWGDLVACWVGVGLATLQYLPGAVQIRAVVPLLVSWWLEGRGERYSKAEQARLRVVPVQLNNNNRRFFGAAGVQCSAVRCM